MFRVKDVLKICNKFTEEHFCQNVISIKLLCNFIEKTFQHGCSPVNMLHIFRTSFPKNTSGRLLLPYNDFFIIPRGLTFVLAHSGCFSSFSSFSSSPKSSNSTFLSCCGLFYIPLYLFEVHFSCSNNKLLAHISDKSTSYVFAWTHFLFLSLFFKITLDLSGASTDFTAFLIADLGVKELERLYSCLTGDPISSSKTIRGFIFSRYTQ